MLLILAAAGDSSVNGMFRAADSFSTPPSPNPLNVFSSSPPGGATVCRKIKSASPIMASTAVAATYWGCPHAASLARLIREPAEMVATQDGPSIHAHTCRQHKNNDRLHLKSVKEDTQSILFEVVRVAATAFHCVMKAGVVQHWCNWCTPHLEASADVLVIGKASNNNDNKHCKTNNRNSEPLVVLKCSQQLVAVATGCCIVLSCARAVQFCCDSVLVRSQARLRQHFGAVLTWHQTGMAEVNRAVGKVEQQQTRNNVAVCVKCAPRRQIKSINPSIINQHTSIE
jgi:hypothetical protein